MINIISDYKDKTGRDFHQVDQVLGTDDPTAAGQVVIKQLRLRGYTPTAMLQVFGNYTMDRLQWMAAHHAPCVCRVIYINPAHFEEVMEDVRKAKEAQR